MSRPKGSKNKPKAETFEVSRKGDVVTLKINMEKQISGAPINRNSNRGWVNWGEKNNYPMALSSLYYNSIVHKACIDFVVTAIVGEGIDVEKTGDVDIMPNYTETWDEFIEKIVKDYVIFGSYAFQIIKNRDNSTYSFFHQPISEVRCSDLNEDGVPDSYWICPDWTATVKYPPVELPRFGFGENEDIKSGKPYLFVYESYTPDLKYYFAPAYVGALKAIQTEVELIRYDLRSVMNNFTASGVLALNRIDDEKERQDVIQNIENMFQGSDAANSLMIVFKNNDEETPVSFTKFDKDFNHVDLFDETNERTIERIVSAHRIPSKQLVGFSSDNAQLGGSGNELNVGFKLFNETVAKRMRKNVVNTINKMFLINGIELNIELKPLDFSIETNDNNDTVATD